MIETQALTAPYLGLRSAPKRAIERSMRASRAQALGWLLAASLFAARATPAQAEPPRGSYDFALRAGFGGGLGNQGIPVRLGLATEYWPAAYFGIGATAALSYKVAFGGDFKARGGAVLAAVRMAPRGHYWMLGAGLG